MSYWNPSIKFITKHKNKFLTFNQPNKQNMYKQLQTKLKNTFIRPITTTSTTPTPSNTSTPIFNNVTNYIYTNNRQIDAFIKSKNPNSALELFHSMQIRDTVSYNLIISSSCLPPKKAFHLYTQMGLLGIRETSTTFASVITLCTNAGFCIEGSQVHCRVVKFGFLKNVFVGGALVGFYMGFKMSGVAVKLFDELSERNLAVWNVMLRGFCEMGDLEELLGFYSRMCFEDVEPNGVSFCYLIRGCSSDRRFHEGRMFQSCVLKMGLVESNVFVANGLVDFYSSCGCFVGARKCFEGIKVEDVISWNSLVSVYADNNLVIEALGFFDFMLKCGHRPSVRSFVGFLNLCSRTKDIGLGKQIQCCVVKFGFDESSVFVQSALIDMYGKCLDIESSVAVFECLPKRTLECCNSLMTSLSHCGAIEDVVELFGLMVDEGLMPDEVTVSTTLKALFVSASASFTSSLLLHCFALKSGVEGDTVVACSLMDAYSRCGHVELSHQIFESVRTPNTICYTSMINGYARNGMGKEGLSLLHAMIKKGVKPDGVTFLCALTGCSHTGLIEEGRLLFNSMESLHNVHPDRRHFSCMVDLLCRAGLLHEAEEFLLKAHGKGDCFMWSSLLQSCRVHKNDEVGTRAAEMLVNLDPDDPAVWLQASNFYAEIGKFDASRQIRDVAIARKMTREIGCSLIEIRQ